MKRDRRELAAVAPVRRAAAVTDAGNELTLSPASAISEQSAGRA